MNAPTILHSDNQRTRLMRRDTAEILTRLFFVERSLILSQSGWLVRTPRIEHKALLGRALWEDSVAANNVRERIFELRYPRRDINVELHTAVISLYDEARNAPGTEAFVGGLVKVLKPALLEAYQSYSNDSDQISDGPSALLLRHATADLEAQIDDLNGILAELLVANPSAQGEVNQWVDSLKAARTALGTTLLDMTTDPLERQPELAGRVPFELPARPARDPRFPFHRFYWPHIVDSQFPSDAGIHLQLRSAVGHLNEAWAAEAAAVALYGFGGSLEWEFIRDVARWTYDESRHCLMGYRRLLDWGFQPEELPMGDYLYTTAMLRGPLYALGMLHHFEAKYIHRGHERIETFTAYDDAASRHDYEFDWADETFHAEYGRRWLDVLLGQKGMPVKDVDELREQCDQMVAAAVQTATTEEIARITGAAEHLIDKARLRVGSN